MYVPQRDCEKKIEVRDAYSSLLFYSLVYCICKFACSVRNLIQPRNTHMDLNIGTAFWFASRGRGYLINASNGGGDSLEELYNVNAYGRPLLRVTSNSGGIVIH